MKELKTFIAEQLIKTRIFEMAKSLKDYKDLVGSIIDPLLIHILLVMDSQKDGSNGCINHWKKEIKGFIYEIKNVRLKTKNDFSHRKRYIQDVLINDLELDTCNSDYIYKFYSKLYSEGYDLDNLKTSERFFDLFKKFQDNYLDKLIDVISDPSMDQYNINYFVDSL